MKFFIFALSKRILLSALCIMTISACVPKSSPNDNSEQSRPEQKVNADNIYHLLLANVAYHQNADNTALDALSKVAKDSRNIRVLEDAISLAYRLEQPETLRELNEILLEVDPQNEYARINSAWQAFKDNQTEKGINELITYLQNLQNTQPDNIRSASTVILAQDRDTQDSVLYELTHTKNVNTYLTAAIIYGLNQRDDLHLKWLDETLELDPGLQYAAILKLDYFLKRGETDVKQLKRFTRQHLRKNPAHTRFRMLYASYLIDIQDYDTAIQQLEAAAKHDPENENTYYVMGLTYLQNDDTEKAISAFQKAININPNNDQSRFYLADAYESLQQHDDAISALNGIVSDENYFDAQIRIGLIIGQTRSLDDGISYLQNIDTHSDDEKLNIISAQESLYSSNKQWQKALSLLNAALQQFPDNLDLLYNRGYIHAVTGNVKQHEQDMRKIIDVDPQRADALNALGYTLADQTNRYQEALSLIEQAYALSPQSPYILDSLGWVYYRLGENEKALEYLLKAFSILEDAEIATHIGEVYWKLGEQKQAKAYWQKAENLDPENETLAQTRKRLLDNN